MKKNVGLIALAIVTAVVFVSCPDAAPPIPIITIDTQPAETTNFTAGDISGNLSIIASVTEGAARSYQWFSNTVNTKNVM